MAYDKNYYDEKKRNINLKYVKSMEELVDELALTLNKFFAYKAELNEQLRDIASRELTGQAAEEPAVDATEAPVEGDTDESTEPAESESGTSD